MGSNVGGLVSAAMESLAGSGLNNFNLTVAFANLMGRAFLCGQTFPSCYANIK